MAGNDKGDHFSLLAFIDGRLAAFGSLHLRPGGWKRHIGKVHFLTSPAHRGLGLIDLMVNEIIEVSLHCGLSKLETEINGEREVGIKALQGAGFCELIRIPDYIQDISGQPHDYVLLGMDLIPSFENLGTGD
ncbi:MAG: GNAT family N-acetyltransferase [Verrucomicrobiales bacterium]|nr:GNAT family N-acetyltransferase [Verrucomicrobiales bacterium]